MRVVWMMLTAVLGLAACDQVADVLPKKQPENPIVVEQREQAKALEAQPAPFRWVGRWNGVEGTYIYIQKDMAGFSVTLANLDGPLQYRAKQVGDTLVFQRNNTTETVRASDGEGTGMKWLADKEDCLVVRAGEEGFCR